MTSVGSVIAISIHDFGSGMSEEQLDDLFQEFEQIPREEKELASTPAAPGSDDKKALGLGLAVVARFIRNMNGQIKIRSTPGEGTTFTIELPFEHVPPSLIDQRRELDSWKDLLTPPADDVSRSPLDQVTVPNIYSLGSVPNQLRAMVAEATFKEHFAETIDVPEPLQQPQTDDVPVVLQEEIHPPTSNPIPDCEHAIRSPPMMPAVSSPLSSESNVKDGDSISPSDAVASAVVTGAPDFLSVLVAEDNPINARILHKRLLKMGHHVEVVPDGQSCYDVFVARPCDFDIILMDIQVCISCFRTCTTGADLADASRRRPPGYSHDPGVRSQLTANPDTTEGPHICRLGIVDRGSARPICVQRVRAILDVTGQRC